jgi:mono/diheme cytochrome c family protein
MHTTTHVRLTLMAAAALLVTALPTAAEQLATDSDRSGREIYRVACSNCHGADGRGVSKSRVGFDVPLPDFTDCSFASREPDGDWMAVAHAGGPTRGFSRMMPAFGGVLSMEEIQRVTDHLRTFCGDDDWPSGNLNLPRALFTEKAFVEDEAVLTTAVTTDGPTDGADRIDGEIVYEQRFGARNQFELVVPFGWREVPSAGDESEGDWTSSVGDIAVGVKRVFWHSLERGAIVSATAEVILPTGDEENGFGKGTTVFEPFVSYGQVLPADFFLHGQAGFEIPFDTDVADNEAFLRGVLGWSTSSGLWGRTWSPMVELLGARELVSGADTDWDIVPQIQITLNTRQHIMMNIGVRTPLNNTEGRSTQVVAYLLWDWFDGSLFEGW